MGRDVRRTPGLARASYAHPLAGLVTMFTEPTEVIANVPWATPMPPGLVAHFPCLASYATIGEVRDEIEICHLAPVPLHWPRAPP